MHYLCCPRLCFRRREMHNNYPRRMVVLPNHQWCSDFRVCFVFCPCSPLHVSPLFDPALQGYIQRVQTASGQSRKVEVLPHFAGSLELCTVPRNIQLVRHSVFCLLDWCSLSFLIQRCGLSVSPMASLFRRFHSVPIMGKRYRRLVHRYGRVLRRIGACVTR